MTNNLGEIKNALILVDANIIIKYATATFAERCGNVLESIASEKLGNKLFISSFTIFELFINSKSNNKISTRLTEAYREALTQIQVLPFTESMAHNIGFLKEFHTKVFGGEGGTNDHGDLIIGSSVLTIHSTPEISKPIYLVTCDRKDFREPLWETVFHVFVPEDRPNTGEPTNLYILKLNDELLSKYLKGEL